MTRGRFLFPCRHLTPPRFPSADLLSAESSRLGNSSFSHVHTHARTSFRSNFLLFLEKNPVFFYFDQPLILHVRKSSPSYISCRKSVRANNFFTIKNSSWIFMNHPPHILSPEIIFLPLYFFQKLPLKKIFVDFLYFPPQFSFCHHSPHFLPITLFSL